MFFILSKILFYLAMPSVWIVMMLILALASRNPLRRKRRIITTLVMFLFFTNSFFVNEVLHLWEKDPVPIAPLPFHQTAIVLTGVVNNNRTAPDRVYFQKGGDRVFHTVQLYKAGKIKRIIITGGSTRIIGHDVAKPEAEQLRDVFIYCGVSPGDIMTEDLARNTHENAVNVKKMLDSMHLHDRPLLVTSAFHMRRAEGAFNKIGLQVDAYPVDYQTSDRNYSPMQLMPNAMALVNWDLFLHEFTGYLVYKIMGYS